MAKRHWTARLAPRALLRRRLIPRWLNRLNRNHDTAAYLRGVGCPKDSAVLTDIEAESAQLRLAIGVAMTRVGAQQ